HLDIGLFLRRFLGWDVEPETAVVVGLDGGGHVEIGKRNPLRSLVENIHRLAHDGVVAHFLLMPVAEDEDAWFVGLGLTQGSVWFRGCRPWRVGLRLLRVAAVSLRRRLLDHDM